MSLSISKLLNLAGDANNKNQDLLGSNPDIPNRYNKIKGSKAMRMTDHKNHNYSPYDFDEFNEVMKQTGSRKYDVTGLHWNLKQKKGTEPLFQETEGWIDPAQRRRSFDPNHAPPFDYVNGAKYQEFGTDKTEQYSHDNVSLIKTAHTNYNNWLNRYNMPTIPVTIQK